MCVCILASRVWIFPRDRAWFVDIESKERDEYERAGRRGCCTTESAMTKRASALSSVVVDRENQSCLFVSQASKYYYTSSFGLSVLR